MKGAIERFKRSNGRVCPGASSVREAETGDAPSPRSSGRYYLREKPRKLRPYRELEREIVERQVRRAGGDVIHVRAYRGPDWFTTAGVLKKRRQIEARGLPSFRLWRFLTLTFRRVSTESDPGRAFDTPLEAYLAGKAKLRKFMDAARKAGLWKSGAKWCWKLEFQKDGWAHWHLLVERTDKFTGEDMAKLNELWAFGRVNVQMVRNQDFLYQFKYAFKPVMSDDAERHAFAVPAWFADYCAPRSVTVDGVTVEKPGTFARARFWQTSKGFYTGEQEQAEKSEADPVKSFFPSTVREVVERKACAVQVVARTKSGRYLASGVITLSCLTGEFWDRVGFETFVGGAVGLAVNSYVIPASIIERNTNTPWLLKPLRDKNRLTLLRAAILQRAGESLRTC